MDFLIELIKTVGVWGYVILFLIIFLESFPPTFFFPGDSLLFITGFLASQGHFNLVLLVATLFIASVSGYAFSYAMGKKLRVFILNSNDRYWFKKRHLEYTEDYYARYGAKTVVIGRFIPIVRSFSPTLAGAVDMDYSKFSKLSILGGLLWTGGLTTASYYLGGIIPHAERFLTPIVIAIIFVSLLPTIAEYMRRLIKKRQSPKI